MQIGMRLDAGIDLQPNLEMWKSMKLYFSPMPSVEFDSVKCLLY